MLLKKNEKKEKKVLKFLRKQFPLEDIKQNSKFSVLDFSGINTHFELKSRRIPHDKYGSLIFGKNKYDKGLEYISNNEKVYFIFNCLDGLYLWEQNLQQSPHFAKGGRFDRGRPEVQELAHIPIDWLSKIH